MADIPVTAVLVAARMATASVGGVANGDTISITLPAGFVKDPNPLPPDAGAPRYRIVVMADSGGSMQAYSVVWAVAVPEIVMTLLIIAGPATLFIVIENVHSIIT